MPQLYSKHLQEVRRRYDRALETGGFDMAVIGAGVMEYRYLDDQPHPYIAAPDFLQWIPLRQHPGSCIVYRPGERPVLLLHRPEDFWHEPPAMPGPAQAAEFDVRPLATIGEIAQQLPSPERRPVFLGPDSQWQETGACGPRNPPAVLNAVHFHRAWKTDWEVDCIRQAARRAGAGHRAAVAAFQDGKSEYEIHGAFLQACGDLDEELPYPAIIGINNHSATLHYQRRDRTAVPREQRRSMLIDAGCSFNGYACDITRTWSAHDDDYAAMIRDVDRMQQELCGRAVAGTPFGDLQRAAHIAVAGLLRDWDLVREAPENQWSAGVTAHFFPHGLGHLLGLQVHDLGGQMADESGQVLPQPKDFPKLRLTRTLAAGQVLTIEPGIYFIESLLRRLRDNPLASRVNWQRIEALKPCGGIRIEDDILVTRNGTENLTRPHL